MPIKGRAHWPGMSFDVKRWCKQCDICAKTNKRGPGLDRSPLHQSVTGAPLDRVDIDIVGPLPVTNDGNEYLIALCDYFLHSGQEAYPVPNTRNSALTVGYTIDSPRVRAVCNFM